MEGGKIVFVELKKFALNHSEIEKLKQLKERLEKKVVSNPKIFST